MHRTFISLIASLFAGPALADLGHFADLAGHDHWVAGAAIGAAALAGLWGILRGGKKTTEEEPAEDMEEEPA